MIESRKMPTNKKTAIEDLIRRAGEFRFCGPSDDPDEQTAVTVGYHHLVAQFKRLVGPILPDEAAFQLKGIEVEIDNIYSAYKARSELDALLPEIQSALAFLDEGGISTGVRAFMVDPSITGRDTRSVVQRSSHSYSTLGQNASPLEVRVATIPHFRRLMPCLACPGV